MIVVTAHLIITTSKGFKFLPKVLIITALIVMIKHAKRIKAIPLAGLSFVLIIGKRLSDVLFTFPVSSVNGTA